MREATHSPLPWRQLPARPHALCDATGEPVLLACQVTGGPHREIANLDLIEAAVNDHALLYEVLELTLQALLRTFERVIMPPPEAVRSAAAIRAILDRAGPPGKDGGLFRRALEEKFGRGTQPP